MALCKVKNGLTKRAPDAGDSAHIPSIFLRLIIFLAGRLRRPRPSAGNANRWAAGAGVIIKTKGLICDYVGGKQNSLG